MKNLKTIYILLLFIFLLLWSFVSYQIYSNSKSKLIKKEYLTLRSISTITGNSITDFTTKTFDDLGTLVSFPGIQKMSPQGKMMLKKYFLNHSNLYEGITRLDSNGVILYTISDNREKAIGKNVSFQKHNREILKDRVPNVSDIFKTVQGFWAISFAYPIYDKDGNFLGVISLLVKPETIFNKFLLPQSYLEQERVYLVSNDGRILYSPVKSELGIKLNRFNKANPKMEFFSSLGDKVNHETTFIDSSNGRVAVENLATVSSIKLTNRDWFLVLSVPKTFALKEMDEFQSRFSLLDFLLIIFVIVITFVLYHNDSLAKRKLIEQKELFEIVSNKTGILVYDVDLLSNDVIVEGSTEGVIGYDHSELSKFTLDKMKSLIHPEDRDTYEKYIEDLINQKSESGTLEYRIRNKKGRYVYVEDNFSFLKNSEGNIVRKIGSLKDITFKKVAEEELLKYDRELELLVEERTKALEKVARDLEIEIDEKKRREIELEEAKRKADAANKLKSEFLAQISHEIRTPINTILSHASLVRLDLDDQMDEDMATSFKAIENASQRIVRTVELILNMADLQTGSYEAHFHKYDLYSDILRRLSLELMPLAERKGLQLIIEPPEVDTTAYIDEFSMRQILSNLVDNSIKYTEKGFVKVMFKRDEKERLVVSISDTGIGIKKEYLPHLFDAFSQEMQGYTRKFEGNGLGLALVKKYAIINKIDITVETEVGKGTTFNLIFNNVEPSNEEV